MTIVEFFYGIWQIFRNKNVFREEFLLENNLFGVRQSGDLNFEIADIFRDASILKKASDAAGYILSLDGTLELPQHRLLKEKLEEYAGRQSSAFRN